MDYYGLQFAKSMAHHSTALAKAHCLCLSLTCCHSLHLHRPTSPPLRLSCPIAQQLQAVQQQLGLLLDSFEGKLPSNLPDQGCSLCLLRPLRPAPARLQVSHQESGICQPLDQVVDIFAGLPPCSKAPAPHPPKSLF